MNPFQDYDDEMLEPSIEGPVEPRRRRRRRAEPPRGRWGVDPWLKIWLILLLAGGGVMFVSFFVPWWRGHVVRLNLSKWAFGWDSATGITVFVLSFFIIAWGIVPWFVRVLKPWAWIGFFVCMVMGLLTFILNLVWYFRVPSKDVAGEYSQTVIAGPYLLMPATLAVFVGGLLGGIFGLLAFLKRS